MKDVENIYSSLDDLINYYEYYLMKHDNASLNVIIDDETISFYLTSGEADDELIIRFDEKDKDTLNYLAIRIIIKIFGHVVMHLDNTTLYNNVHKKNIKIDILNDYLRSIVEKLITIQDSEFINCDLQVVKDLNKKANKRYPKKFMLQLKDRINLSKKMLRN